MGHWLRRAELARQRAEGWRRRAEEAQAQAATLNRDAVEHSRAVAREWEAFRTGKPADKPAAGP